MDKSQSRTSRIPAPRFDHQFKLTAALTLAVIASGYFLWEAFDRGSVHVDQQLAVSECAAGANSSDNSYNDCDAVSL